MCSSFESGLIFGFIINTLNIFCNRHYINLLIKRLLIYNYLLQTIKNKINIII